MRVPRGSFATALIQVLALSLCSTHTAPAQEWPSFRGAFARGVADGQNLPADWDVKASRNVR